MAQPEKLTLEVPAALAQELAAASQDFLADLLQRGLRDLRIEHALDRYRQGGVSFAAVAEQAGVSQSELARHAYVRGMEPPYSPASLAEEIR